MSRQKWFQIAFVVVVLVTVLSMFSTNGEGPTPDVYSYSQLLREVYLQDRTVRGLTQQGERFYTYAPEDPGLIGNLLEAGVEVRA